MLEILRTHAKGEPVPAISLMQPWATAVVILGKDVENRSRWPFKYRGPIVIHASRTMPTREDFDWFLKAARKDGIGVTDLKLLDPGNKAFRGDLFPQGVVLGVAKLDHVFSPTSSTPRGHPARTSPWRINGAGAWLYLSQAIEVEPVPFRGAVGMFKVPYEIAVALRPIPEQ